MQFTLKKRINSVKYNLFMGIFSFKYYLMMTGHGMTIQGKCFHVYQAPRKEEKGNDECCLKMIPSIICKHQRSIWKI